MTEAAAKFPPLWPGSTATTLPLRIPVRFGRNSSGPPLVPFCCGLAEAALLPGAGFALAGLAAAGSGERPEPGTVAGSWPAAPTPRRRSRRSARPPRAAPMRSGASESRTRIDRLPVARRHGVPDGHEGILRGGRRAGNVHGGGVIRVLAGV